VWLKMKGGLRAALSFPAIVGRMLLQRSMMGSTKRAQGSFKFPSSATDSYNPQPFVRTSVILPAPSNAVPPPSP